MSKAGVGGPTLVSRGQYYESDEEAEAEFVLLRAPAAAVVTVDGAPESASGSCALIILSEIASVQCHALIAQLALTRSALIRLGRTVACEVFTGASVAPHFSILSLRASAIDAAITAAAMCAQ